jgi:hypothetical protein
VDREAGVDDRVDAAVEHVAEGARGDRLNNLVLRRHREFQHHESDSAGRSRLQDLVGVLPCRVAFGLVDHAELCLAAPADAADAHVVQDIELRGLQGLRTSDGSGYSSEVTPAGLRLKGVGASTASHPLTRGGS